MTSQKRKQQPFDIHALFYDYKTIVNKKVMMILLYIFLFIRFLVIMHEKNFIWQVVCWAFVTGAVSLAPSQKFKTLYKHANLSEIFFQLFTSHFNSAPTIIVIIIFCHLCLPCWLLTRWIKIRFFRRELWSLSREMNFAHEIHIISSWCSSWGSTSLLLLPDCITAFTYSYFV